MNVEWLRLLRQFEPLVLYHRGGHSEGDQLREMKRNRNKIDSDALEKFQLSIIHPLVIFFLSINNSQRKSKDSNQANALQ